jgi:hypothetical protein
MFWRPFPRRAAWSGVVSPVEKQFSQSELEAIAAALGNTSEGLTGSEIGHITGNPEDGRPESRHDQVEASAQRFRRASEL